MLTRVTLALCLLVGVTSTASAQKDAPPDLDHFKCYYTLANLTQVPMLLRDQFDEARGLVTNFADIRIARFCNPVEKTVLPTPGVTFRHSRITNPGAHLTMFHLAPQPIVPRQVWIRNQFGNQQLALRDAAVLAVPTAAEAIVPGTESVASLPLPTGLDHFKCYNASGRRLDAMATLHDEFNEGSTRVLEPVAFCNPVEKTRLVTPTGKELTPITNPVGHLTCYTIAPMRFGGLTVLITNQFGSGHLNVGPPDELCVPSLKLRWIEVP